MPKVEHNVRMRAKLLQFTGGPALIIDAKARDERYTIALTLDALDAHSLEAVRQFSDLATIRAATMTGVVAG